MERPLGYSPLHATLLRGIELAQNKKDMNLEPNLPAFAQRAARAAGAASRSPECMPPTPGPIHRLDPSAGSSRHTRRARPRAGSRR